MSLDNKNIQGADALLEKLEEARRYLETDALTVIGQEAVNFFKNNFQVEGFVDSAVTKWASRKTKREGGTNGQKTLTKSGDLGDSIDFRVQGNTVIIYTDLPYAEIHNNGGEVPVTPQMKKYFWAKHMEANENGRVDVAEQYKYMALAKKLVFPKRQFIGPSEKLNENINGKLTRDLTKILS
ncbi:phage virion morphogenesis protein [Pinibacter soli]|uniref:Phage virion morphogenesis protein n=1 Tax=Pinibacter soli TaxID=3044211 RepID=A0ABT6R9I4_9BACT|nr:phage virion morphogenesis protein [Pinibacter soli]MDI3319141.1 phage virion morphogenesis protein [Pinibacter soli]